ncbi:MAG: DUF4296 domain-containing protein [Flavobacteriales bacterium]
MRRLLLAWVMLLGACGDREALPPTPLDRGKFVQVLTGALMIEARLGHEMNVDRRTDSPIQQYYDDLFREEGVTQAEFRATYDSYAAHPKELKAVYDDVLVRLQQMQDAKAAPADSTAH